MERRYSKGVDLGMVYNKIKLQIIEGSIKVENFSEEIIHVYFADIDSNYSIYSSKLVNSTFAVCNIHSGKRKVSRIYINTEFGDIHVFDIKKINDEFNIIYLNLDEDFNFNNSFIFLGGHTGGGTSIVCKMLRYLGCHFGNDSGLKENRKAHESFGLRCWVDNLNKYKTIYVAREKFKKILGAYGYIDKEINCFKYPDLYKNSIFLGEIFPNSKFISIIRKQNNFHTTREGEGFNTLEYGDLINKQKFNIEGNPVFHLDFYKFFTDFIYVNKLLSYIGSDIVIKDNEEFEDLLQKINFNKEVLK